MTMPGEMDHCVSMVVSWGSPGCAPGFLAGGFADTEAQEREETRLCTTL